MGGGIGAGHSGRAAAPGRPPLRCGSPQGERALTVRSGRPGDGPAGRMRLNAARVMAAAPLGMVATKAGAQETFRVGRAIANSCLFVPIDLGLAQDSRTVTGV